MKKRKCNLPIKLISLVTIIFLALVFIIGYSWKVLKSSDYFNIKDIITNEGDVPELSYLEGKNIFSVDLRSESSDILAAYPNYSGIRLVRVLPNRIFVNFIKRKPLALVKLYRYFALDQNGVLFYPTDQPEEPELPIILGLETKIFGVQPGKSYYNIKELMLSLYIIKEVKRNRLLKNYKIKKIDVTNIANTSIFIPHPLKTKDSINAQAPMVPIELEVRLGKDKIKDKITILSGLIIGAKDDLPKIKYIDLRFKEPVIKFKFAQ